MQHTDSEGHCAGSQRAGPCALNTSHSISRWRFRKDFARARRGEALQYIKYLQLRLDINDISYDSLKEFRHIDMQSSHSFPNKPSMADCLLSLKQYDELEPEVLDYRQVISRTLPAERVKDETQNVSNLIPLPVPQVQTVETVTDIPQLVKVVDEVPHTSAKLMGSLSSSSRGGSMVAEISRVQPSGGLVETSPSSASILTPEVCGIPLLGGSTKARRRAKKGRGELWVGERVYFKRKSSHRGTVVGRDDEGIHIRSDDGGRVGIYPKKSVRDYWERICLLPKS